MSEIGEGRLPGVYTDGERLFTRNLVPGERVYGERLFTQGGTEYREWNPRRSKLAAYIMLGGEYLPFSGESRVLYLGAASGTTASHVSDLVPRGTVYCVEFSRRAFRDLVGVCESRGNMVPILADASLPSGFGFALDRADCVYQDIAQRGQVDILCRNMRFFRSRRALLALKSRSEDVSVSPRRIFQRAEKRLLQEGMRVEDLRPLDPYERDHAMIGVSR